MKAICELARLPAGITLLADDILEFHAARILLLIRLCGTKNRIDGLTKLAKLDFFVRYPQFFDRACAASGEHVRSASDSIEASMVRHHYGPWDHRYYDVLAYLRSRGLIEIRKDRKTFKFYLTEIGINTAERFQADSSYQQLCAQMSQVKSVFGKKTGSALKELIYKIFEEEVAQKPLGEVIN